MWRKRCLEFAKSLYIHFENKIGKAKTSADFEKEPRLFPDRQSKVCTISIAMCFLVWNIFMVTLLPDRQEIAELVITTTQDREEDSFLLSTLTEDGTCIVYGDNGQCFPIKCNDDTPHFYHRKILRKKGMKREEIAADLTCVTSKGYKFVYLINPKDADSDNITNLLTGCLCEDGLDGQCDDDVLQVGHCGTNRLQNADHFVFSFVRNPYSITALEWQMKAADQPDVSFSGFVDSHSSVDGHTQSDSVFNGWQCPSVDFVGKWESFQVDFEDVLQHVWSHNHGFPIQQCLDRTMNVPDLKSNWMRHYDVANHNHVQQKVHDHYKADFDHFGYSSYFTNASRN